MRRDRLTFGMMVGIPLIQLVLFGFAINSNPKNLPAVVVEGSGEMAQTFLYALENSGYFDLRGAVDERGADEALLGGQALFAIHFPVDFERQFLRGERPSILLEADATDPLAAGGAINVFESVAAVAWNRDLEGVFGRLIPERGPVQVVVHARFNPESISQYNIVPGLMGVILTLTMVMITSLAITRERERGTMENLLSMPVRPIEVMIGKIVPYLMVGYLQVVLILVAAKYLFQVPTGGAFVTLFLSVSLFIAANLAVGVTFSSLAANQLQAVQMSVFFFLPSILLSGFMFPFLGMPLWARWLGEILPLTHFLRIVRGVMLKGAEIGVVMQEIWPIAIFLVVVLFVAVKRYRQTMD